MENERLDAVKSMEAALSEGNSKEAVAIMHQKRGLFSAENPAPNRLLLRMINDLHEDEQWDESVPLMEQLLRQVPTPQPTVQLKLAQILYRVSKPSRALEFLQSLPDGLSPDQTRLRQQLSRLAQKAISEA